MNNSTVLAAIFDLDGTLVNSLDDLADAANAALAQFGYRTHPLVAYKHFVGNGLEMMARRALAAAQTAGPSNTVSDDAQCTPTPPASEMIDATKRAEVAQAELARVVEALRSRYDKAWNVKTKPYAGVTDLLRALDRNGVLLGVLSNKPHAWTCEIVRSFFPDIPFAEVRGAKPDIPHKPDPTAALQMAESMGVPPCRTLFVGDSNVDILTGVRAGMTAVGVTWGFRDVPELKEAGASILIDHPSELLSVLTNCCK